MEHSFRYRTTSTCSHDSTNSTTTTMSDAQVQTTCERLHAFNTCDLLVRNVGTHVNNRTVMSGVEAAAAVMTPGPLVINELYFGDSLASNPPILPALMFSCVILARGNDYRVVKQSECDRVQICKSICRLVSRRH